MYGMHFISVLVLYTSLKRFMTRLFHFAALVKHFVTWNLKSAPSIKIIIIIMLSAFICPL